MRYVIMRFLKHVCVYIYIYIYEHIYEHIYYIYIAIMRFLKHVCVCHKYCQTQILSDSNGEEGSHGVLLVYYHQSNYGISKRTELYQYTAKAVLQV